MEARTPGPARKASVMTQSDQSDSRAQEWRLSLYRDDSETTVVIDRVKHAFMTAGNTILTVAAYASDGSHFYINWPRERVCWWKLERRP